MADRTVLVVPRRRWLPLAVVVAVAVLVVAAGTAMARGLPQQGGDTGRYRTAVVATGSVQQTLTVTGTATRVGQVTASFPLAGTVAGVDVAVGDQVSAGQRLATLDPTALQQAVLDAQTALDQARATWQSDQAAVAAAASASAAAASAAAAAARSAAAAAASAAAGPAPGAGNTVDLSGLTAAGGAVSAAQKAADAVCAPVLAPSSTGNPPSTSPSTTTSPTTSVTSVADCQAALAALSGAQAKESQAAAAAAAAVTKAAGALSASAARASTVTGSPGSPSSGTTARAATGTSAQVSESKLILDASLVTSAEAALTKATGQRSAATLLAPVAGVVGSVAFSVGASASPGSGIVIVTPGAANITVSVPLANLPAVALGQRATVTPAGASALEGAVASIALLPNSSSSPAYDVVVTVPQAGDTLATGAKASVAIATSRVDNALVVPVSAVTTVGTGTGSVGVLTDGVLTTATVRTGVVGQGRVQILSGLTAGQTVVLADAAAALPTNGTGGFRGVGAGGGIAGVGGGAPGGAPGGGPGGGGRPGG